MILERHYLACLAHASYLIADQRSGEAAVVDPQRDVDCYLESAAKLGCRIRHVFLTHFHADFVAGHLELRDREGATIYLGARASAEYPFKPMRDGETLSLGRVRLEVLETPGHSPESISILVHDPDHDSNAPYAVLTGDTLFVGDVGRPDLRASLGWSAEELGGLLYDSLREKLLTLADQTLVYPAHGAGSLCGKNLGTEAVSTIGEQRLYNYALKPMSKQAFVRIVTSDQPDTPAYFTYDAVLNTREHPTLQETLARQLRPLALAHALRLQKDGGQVLDTREAVDFEGAHLRGSLNVGLGGAFATWCGTILAHERPIVIVAEPGREVEAATRLGRIGFDTVAGYLAGGMEALKESPELLQSTTRVTAATLAEQLGGVEPPVVVDVRSPREWEQGHIEPSLNIPLARLAERAGILARERSIVVYCASGYRSAIAAALLTREGLPRVTDLVGGLCAWESTRLPTAA